MDVRLPFPNTGLSVKPHLPTVLSVTAPHPHLQDLRHRHSKSRHTSSLPKHGLFAVLRLMSHVPHPPDMQSTTQPTPVPPKWDRIPHSSMQLPKGVPVPPQREPMLQLVRIHALVVVHSPSPGLLSYPWYDVDCPVQHAGSPPRSLQPLADVLTQSSYKKPVITCSTSRTNYRVHR